MKNSLKDIVRRYAKKEPDELKTLPNAEIAQKLKEKHKIPNDLDIIAQELRNYMSNNRIKKERVFDFGEHFSQKQTKAEVKKDKTEIFRLKQLLNLDKVQDYSGIYKIEERYSKSIGEATAVLVFSDLHAEERIDSVSTNGLNRYNPDIAKKRTDKFFINAPKLIENNRANVRINDVVLMLLGDNIHGWIHEEFQSSNYMKPVEATLYAENLIISGIEHLLQDKGIKSLKIVCKIGNHSRTTDKVYSDNEALLSFEFMIYKHIERYFAADKRVEVIIENAYFTYIKIYDFMNRCHHGHAIRFAGGVGGLTVPLMKFIYRANEQHKADYDWIGHFHTRMALPNVLINGSVCGFNGYCSRKGLRPEKPMQSFALIDKKRGLTVTAPVFLE